MSTRQDTPPIGRLLREKRDNGYKSVAAKALGVSRQAYDAWESGHHVPGDEWATALADYLELDIREMVWLLYVDRIRGGPLPEGVSSHIAPLRRRSVDYGTLSAKTHPQDNRPPNRPPDKLVA